jgi:hypothetical protein
MPSIGKLATGPVSYYLDQAEGRVVVVESTGDGTDDYAGGAKARGVWVAPGAAALGLSRAVLGAALRRVPFELDLGDATPLRNSWSAVQVQRAPAAQLTTTAERIAEHRLERPGERSLGHGLER